MTLAIPALYLDQDALTDPGTLAGLYGDVPRDPSGLRSIVADLIVHVSWATRYGIPPDVPKPRDTQPVANRLRLIQLAFGGPLTALRPPERRTFGTCRDFSLMFCSLLRHRSIAARVRCGFATYFSQGPYEDHWICEFWSPGRMRWVRADAQLDQVHQDHLGIEFDCADLPSGAFLSAGEAWRLARSGSARPEEFGHGEAKGLWIMRVNVYRDLLALTNAHISAWDTWREATAQSKILDESDIASVDRLVAEIAAVESAGGQIMRLVEIASGCRIPPWRS